MASPQELTEQLAWYRAMQTAGHEWCTRCGTHEAHGNLCPVCLDDERRLTPAGSHAST